MSVLLEPAITHLGEAEHPLDDPDRMFDPGPHFGLGTIFCPLDFIDDTAVAVAAIDEILGLWRALPDHRPLAAVGLISTKDVGRLMRLFHGTIEALAVAQQCERDGFVVVDETVGWTKLLGVRGEVKSIADLAEEDSLVRAADRYVTLRKFAPELLEVLEFKAARGNDPTLSAIKLLQDLNRSGKRNVPPDAPMPFRKDWKQLVVEGGSPSRRLYETAVFATLRDNLRSGDIWVEQSSALNIDILCANTPQA